MRKILTAAVLLAALGAGLPANAADKTATILVPTAANGTEENCLPTSAGCEKSAVARHHRCLYTANPIAAQDNTTGYVGYTIRVTPGAAYTLKPATGSSGDFDITFYEKLGTCSGRVGARDVFVGENPAPTTRTDDHDDHTFGNEAGVVPVGSTWAIITLFGGANAKFVYDEA